MAKQTFTTGSVLTAAAMTSLQQTAMLGGSASAKTASYTLVAADAGTAITMNNASATTITVNTNLFAAGDTVTILNVGAGTCTITAGTATVSKPTNASLALVANAGGILYFTATGSSFFMPFDVGGGSAGKILQVVSGTYATAVATSADGWTDTNLSLSITPSATASRVLILTQQSVYSSKTSGTTDMGFGLQLLRGSTAIHSQTGMGGGYIYLASHSGAAGLMDTVSFAYVDSPSTTSATTYKTQMQRNGASPTITAQYGSTPSSIVLLEIGA